MVILPELVTLHARHPSMASLSPVREGDSPTPTVACSSFRNEREGYDNTSRGKENSHLAESSRDKSSRAFEPLVLPPVLYYYIYIYTCTDRFNEDRNVDLGKERGQEGTGQLKTAVESSRFFLDLPLEDRVEAARQPSVIWGGEARSHQINSFPRQLIDLTSLRRGYVHSPR